MESRMTKISARGDKKIQPSRKASDGEYRDIAHPINSQTRDHIQSLILEKYQELLNTEDGEELEEAAAE